MEATTDARFLAAVIQAANDPTRKAAIMRAATAAPASPRMGTVAEAAKILGTCARTAERYARAGCFPRVHLSPRKVRFDLSAVERYAATGCAVNGGQVA